MTPPRPRLLSARFVLAALFGASVAGFGVAVAIDHSGPTPLAVVGAAAQASPSPSPSEAPDGRGPGGRGFGGGGLGVNAGALVGTLAKDAGKTPMQVLTDIRNGKTLAEIAGSDATIAKIKTDALASVRTALDQARTKGAISQTQEDHLLADASDAIDQLMTAKLGALGLGTMPTHPGGWRGHGPASSPAPTATPAV